MARNNRRNKFDPLFGPELYKVVEVKGAGLSILRLWDNRLFDRHKDDVKKVDAHLLVEPNQGFLVPRTPSGHVFMWGENGNAGEPPAVDVDENYDEAEGEGLHYMQDIEVDDHPEATELVPQKVPKMLRDLGTYNNPGLTEMDSNIALGSTRANTANAEH